MRVARIMQIGVVAVLGLVVSVRAGLAQGRSAVLRVTAQVVDVGALSWVDVGTDPVGAAGPSNAVVTGSASGQAFSVVPPRHAAVAVSMQIDGGPGGSDNLAIQVCRPTDARRGCRQVRFADTLNGRHAAAVTNEAVFVRLTGLTSLTRDSARVTVTLAYPDS